MNGDQMKTKLSPLDKVLIKERKNERKTRYKYIKKLFKARDMAAKYTTGAITISKLDNFYNVVDLVGVNNVNLAKLIIRNEERILGNEKMLQAPKPPKVGGHFQNERGVN